MSSPTRMTVNIDRGRDGTSVPVSTDSTFAGNSDLVVPSQRATKTALDLKAPSMFTQGETLAAPRILSDKFKEAVSVLDFDINAGLDTGDDTVAFNKTTATGRRAYIPDRSLILDNGLIQSAMGIFGEGAYNSELKAKAGSTGAIIISDNFAALQAAEEDIGGTDYKTRGGTSDFTIRDISLNGNYIPTISSGGVVTAVTANASVAGMKIYGSNFKIHDVEISKCRYEGLYAEWSEAGSRGNGRAELEAALRNIKIIYCGRSGINWRGPHDSIHPFLNVAWCNLNFFLNGTDGDFPAINIQNVSSPTGGPTAAGQTLVHPHVWGGSHSVGIDLLATSWIDGGFIEQATEGHIRVRAHGCRITPTEIGALAADPTGMVGVIIAQDAATGADVYNTDIDTYFAGLPTAVSFQDSGGQNRVVVRGYPEAADSNLYIGTPHQTDEIIDKWPMGSHLVTAHHTVSTMHEVVAWARVNLTAGTIISASGIASITKHSTGWFTVNFGRNVGTATEYVPFSKPGATSGSFPSPLESREVNPTATGFTVAVQTPAGVPTDCDLVYISVSGDRTKFK